MSNTITIGGVRLCCQCGRRRMTAADEGSAPADDEADCWLDINEHACGDWRTQGTYTLPWRVTGEFSRNVELVLVAGGRVEMKVEVYAEEYGSVTVVMSTPPRMGVRMTVAGPIRWDVPRGSTGKESAWEWLRLACGPGWMPLAPRAVAALAAAGVLT